MTIQGDYLTGEHTRSLERFTKSYALMHIPRCLALAPNKDMLIHVAVDALYFLYYTSTENAQVCTHKLSIRDGRMYIPRTVIDTLQIEKRITLLGQYDHIEIWNPDQYTAWEQAAVSEKQFREGAEDIFSLE